MRPFGTYFWGLLFIVVGAAFIIRYAFHINIPIFKIVIGFVLIYFGISVLVGAFSPSTKNDVVFENSNIKVESPQDEYNMVFGKCTVDLTQAKLDGRTKKIEVHTVFADGTVRISPDIPAVIKVTSVFGTANMPKNNNISFGESTYRTGAYREGEPYLDIKADVVFGKLDITEW